MTDKPTMAAQEVIALLEISAATLYSYVSRGLVRSQPAAEDSRQRRYLAEDVRRLAERKAQRRDPARAARGALRWGTPVLESALTLITGTGLYYRGHDALELAQTRSLEDVAALFWTDDLGGSDSLFSGDPLPYSAMQPEADFDALSSIQRMQIALTLASESDLSAFNLRPENVARTGARILWLHTQAITLKAGQSGASIADRLARHWGVEHPHVLNAALILCADHELNASSFAARVAASTLANPYMTVLAGLSTLQGFRHGGGTKRVRAFLREVDHAGNVRTAISERMQQGERLPGFGHALYPDGDPRAALLLKLLDEAYPANSALLQAHDVIAETAHITGEASNVDFALVVLERTLGLPQDSALALFALGRTVGWVGHTIEEYASNTLIRPRAEYVGRQPQPYE